MHVAVAAQPVFRVVEVNHRHTAQAGQAVQIEPLMTMTKARGHRLFAGKIDKGKLGFGERAVTLALRVAEGDFRDWAEITAWATTIARAISEEGSSDGG